MAQSRRKNRLQWALKEAYNPTEGIKRSKHLGFQWVAMDLFSILKKIVMKFCSKTSNIQKLINSLYLLFKLQAFHPREKCNSSMQTEINSQTDCKMKVVIKVNSLWATRQLEQPHLKCSDRIWPFFLINLEALSDNSREVCHMYAALHVTETICLMEQPCLQSPGAAHIQFYERYPCSFHSQHSGS